MLRSQLSIAFAAALAAMPAIACAAGTTSGSAQIQWSTAASATMAVATQYGSSFTQGTAPPTLLPSTAGVCTATGAESAFTLTFGALSPAAQSSSACLYKNAVAVSVSTNDASGFAVNQYLDRSLTGGTGVCAFPNGGSSFPLSPVPSTVPASTRTGNPAAGSYTGSILSSCAGGGSVVPSGTGGASSGGTVAGNPGTAALEYYAPSSASLGFLSSATATVNGGSVVTMYGAEDLQINLAGGASSTAAGGAFLTLQLIVN